MTLYRKDPLRLSVSQCTRMKNPSTRKVDGLNQLQQM